MEFAVKATALKGPLYYRRRHHKEGGLDDPEVEGRREDSNLRRCRRIFAGSVVVGGV